MVSFLAELRRITDIEYVNHKKSSPLKKALDRSEICNISVVVRPVGGVKFIGDDDAS